MSREEYLEYIRHLPYDCMGDMSFLLDSDEKKEPVQEKEDLIAD